MRGFLFLVLAVSLTLQSIIVLAQGTVPNDLVDPNWASQIKLQAGYAWVQSHGAGQLSRIMVVDGWIDCTHPDLARACSQDGTVPGEPFNFVSGEPVYEQPGFNHGTHVAGVAVDEGNNGIGTVGPGGISTSVGLVRAKGIRTDNTVDVTAVKASWNAASSIPNLTVIKQQHFCFC